MTLTNITLTHILPLQSGTSKNGEWRKQEFVVETEGQYPKKVCIMLWGDKIDQAKLEIGAKYNIDYDLESREYNSRWYTEVKAWKVEKISQEKDDSHPFNPLTPDDFITEMKTMDKEEVLPF